MTLEILEIKKSASIVDGVIRLYDQGYMLVSLLVLLTSLLFPLAKLLFIFIISVNLTLKRYPDSLPLLMRAFRCLDDFLWIFADKIVTSTAMNMYINQARTDIRICAVDNFFSRLNFTGLSDLFYFAVFNNQITFNLSCRAN